MADVAKIVVAVITGLLAYIGITTTLTSFSFFGLIMTSFLIACTFLLLKSVTKDQKEIVSAPNKGIETEQVMDEKFYKKVWFWVVIGAITLVFASAMSEPSQEALKGRHEGAQWTPEDIKDDTDEAIESTEIGSNAEGLVSFGSAFMFRDFEIQIGSSDEVIWLTVENSFSDYFGHDVVGIPVKVTNYSGESGRLNSFSYKFFGPDGTEVREASSFSFQDYDIWSQGDMRHEASQEGYFMLMYDGDGDYIIEFSGARSGYEEVILPIKK